MVNFNSFNKNKLFNFIPSFYSLKYVNLCYLLYIILPTFKNAVSVVKNNFIVEISSGFTIF